MDEKKTGTGEFIKKLFSSNWKTTYGKIKEFSSDFLGKTIVTGAVLFIAYLFYQFGYGFLYGYYFGGKNTAASPLVGMINQIPFNFKYIVIIGIVLFAILILIFWVSFKIIVEGKMSIKILPFIFFISLLFIAICILLGFLEGNLEIEAADIKLYNIVFYLFYIILLIACITMSYIYIYENILSGLIFIFANCIYFVMIEMLRLIIPFSNPLCWGVFVGAMYTGEVLFISIYFYVSNKINLIHIRFTIFLKKYNKQVNIFYASVFVICFFLFMRFNKQIFLFICLLCFCILIIKSIIMLCRKLYNKISKNKNLPKDKKDYNQIVFFLNHNKAFSQLMGFSFSLIIFVIVYFGLYIATYNMGQYCGTIKETQYSTINILNQNNSSFQGIVVRQEGTTYYISNENRELVIITSNQISVLPSEEATIQNN